MLVSTWIHAYGGVSGRLATLALLCILGACDSEPLTASPTQRPPVSTTATLRDENTADSRTFALLLNGGGSATRNYGSHLDHIRAWVDLLRGVGVPEERVTIFASDGADPAADLAVRDLQPEKAFWLIDGTSMGEQLATKTHSENSVVPGTQLFAARKDGLRLWFSSQSQTMRAGDTLLLYVTDHGKKNRDDLRNNAIVLWGEELSVRELREMIALLPAGVRVVSVMSQCFSGSFAHLMFEGDRFSSVNSNVCGYFSASPERFAYGCYPENRGKNGIGYSFRFLEGLTLHGRSLEAHERTLISDRTPDVPHRSSDTYLRQLLRGEASRAGKSLDALTDELLEQAWKDEDQYRKAFAEIDRIGEAFGSFGPRSVAELDARAANLPGLARDLRAYAKQWKSALSALKSENLATFLAENTFWREYLTPQFLGSLKTKDKREVSAWLLQDLSRYTKSKKAIWARLRALDELGEEAQAASYRMEVRLGTVLRMRTLLTRIAGLVYLDRYGRNEERAAFEGLVACEDLTLGTKHRTSRRDFVLPPPFPAMVDEMQLIATVLPGWLGVDYKPPAEALRTEFELSIGAAQLTKIFDYSPAAGAGLQVGDIVLGPPGEPFAERSGLREWAATSLVDDVRSLLVLRDGTLRTIELRLGTAPVEGP